MISRTFVAQLLEDAEELDRKGHPAQIALLKESYDYFKEIGVSEKEVAEMMALTPQQLNLLSGPPGKKKRQPGKGR